MYRFGRGYTTANHNAGAFGVVRKPKHPHIPGLSHRNCGNSKVPFETVQEIRRLHESEGLDYAELARRFGYSYTAVAQWCEYETRVYR